MNSINQETSNISPPSIPVEPVEREINETISSEEIKNVNEGTEVGQPAEVREFEGLEQAMNELKQMCMGKVFLKSWDGKETALQDMLLTDSFEGEDTSMSVLGHDIVHTTALILLFEKEDALPYYLFDQSQFDQSLQPKVGDKARFITTHDIEGFARRYQENLKKLQRDWHIDEEKKKELVTRLDQERQAIHDEAAEYISARFNSTEIKINLHDIKVGQVEINQETSRLIFEILFMEWLNSDKCIIKLRDSESDKLNIQGLNGKLSSLGIKASKERLDLSFHDFVHTQDYIELTGADVNTKKPEAEKIIEAILADI